MSYFKLYLIFTLIPNLKIFLAIIFLGCVGLIIALIRFRKEINKNNNESFCRWLKLFFVIGIASLFIKSFLPGQEDVIKIVGVQKISHIKNIDKLPENLVKRVNFELNKKRVSLLHELNKKK